MQIIGGKDTRLGPDSFMTGIAVNGGVVILHNLSPYELRITLDDDPTREGLLFGWQPRKFDFCGRRTSKISYQYLNAGQSVSINSPSYTVWGEAYAPGESVPESMPNYDRLSNIGNQVSVSSTPSIDNESLPPGSPLIKSVPTGAAQPSLQFTNDGNGQWTIVSLNALLNFLTIINGDASHEASIVIGDAADTTMLTIHGTIDNASQAGQANSAVVAQEARTVDAFDGSMTNRQSINIYEGTTDPSTYTTPGIGDLWYQG